MINTLTQTGPSIVEQAAKHYGYTPKFVDDVPPAPIEFHASEFEQDVVLRENRKPIIVLELEDHDLALYIAKNPFNTFFITLKIESKSQKGVCDQIVCMNVSYKNGEMDIKHRLVDPRFRRRGLFRYVIDILRKHATDNGFVLRTSSVMLHTAMSFRDIGFEIEDIDQQRMVEALVSGSEEYNLSSQQIGYENVDFVITKRGYEDQTLSFFDTQSHPCRIDLVWRPEPVVPKEATNLAATVNHDLTSAALTI